MIPSDLRYTKEHEWVLVEGDTGTIGITDHAQQELGDIVYVDLPKVGVRVEQAGQRGEGTVARALGGARGEHDDGQAAQGGFAADAGDGNRSIRDCAARLG